MLTGDLNSAGHRGASRTPIVVPHGGVVAQGREHAIVEREGVRALVGETLDPLGPVVVVASSSSGADRLLVGSPPTFLSLPAW